MGNELLINDGIAETRVALLHDGRLDDLIIERRDRPSLVGNVFYGRVSRVLAGLDVAFVDIGVARDGFLRAPDAQYARAESDGAATQRGITRRVAEGEAIIVQVVADAYADKGPKLTTDISLPGRFVVYAPYRDMLSVSRRIDNEDERERLQDVVDEAGDAAELDGGFIVRTAANGAADDAIATDVRRIGEIWHGILERRDKAAPAGEIGGQKGNKAPRVLRDCDEPVIAALRDFVGPAVERIVIDTRDGFNRAQRYLETTMPEFVGRLEHHTGPEALFSRDDIDGAIEEALEPMVSLSSGGTLVIEPTTALIAVDVNSGSGSDSGSAEQTNRDAAIELARQLRVRNLSGTIVVDFIHMGDGRKFSGIIDTLRRGLRHDRVLHRIGELSGFGLLELTRRRVRPPLAELLCDTADAANAPPRRATAVAAQVLRRAEAEAAGIGSSTIRISVGKDVAAVLNDPNTDYLSALRERTARAVEVMIDSDTDPEAFEVIAA